MGILDAQAVALQVLAEHPAVLKEPEPWVLVDSHQAGEESRTTEPQKIKLWLGH